MTTTHNPTRRRAVAASAGLLAAALALAACGSGDDGALKKTSSTAGTPTAAGDANPDVVALLPKSVVDKGELVVGTEAQYPPFEFYDRQQDDRRLRRGRRGEPRRADGPSSHAE
jgi:ABC-type amino acid transport substrate-binding protein